MRYLWVASCFLFLLVIMGNTTQAEENRLLQEPSLRTAIDQLDALFSATLQERNLPGMSVGIVYDDDLIWSKGYGFADLEQQLPADTDSIYEIGSVTKLFNATMLMQLRDAGKLSLDDPIEKYLPEFKMQSRFSDQRPPTFRQLISHTAGLPREYDFDTTHPGELRQFPAAVVLEGIKHKEMQYPAYTGFHYSNLGVYIVGQALQRIAGEPYIQYMQEHIFTPLGMTHTGYDYTSEMAPHRAIGYRPTKEGELHQIAPLFVPGDFGVSAGGIQSSVRDMAKFISLQFNEGPAGGAQILGGTSLREMRSAVVLAPNWMWGYGLGWEVERYPEHPNGICHSGGTYGFASKVRVVPDLKLGFVILINQDTDADDVSRKAVEMLIPTFEILAVKRAQQEGPPLPEYASAFTGHYDAGQYGSIDIVIRDGRLFAIPDEASGGEKSPWLLEARDEHTLLIVSGSGDFNGMTLSFHPPTTTRPAGVEILGVIFRARDQAKMSYHHRPSSRAHNDFRGDC